MKRDDMKIDNAVNEPKWQSAVKLSACFIVIQVNTSLHAIVRESVLGSHGFPSPLFLVFVAQVTSFILASVVCRVRTAMMAQTAGGINEVCACCATGVQSTSVNVGRRHLTKPPPAHT